eukprot:jgi/Psemu1/37335/gm1.37335_g
MLLQLLELGLLLQLKIFSLGLGHLLTQQQQQQQQQQPNIKEEARPVHPSSFCPVAPSIAALAASIPAPATSLIPVAPEDDNDNTLSDSDSDATLIQDYSRNLGIAVEQLQLPPAVTFVPAALACNNIEATPATLPQEFTLAENQAAYYLQHYRPREEKEEAATLAELIPDPESPSLTKHYFFIQCQALLSPDKLALVNYCMLIDSRNPYKMIYHTMDLLKNHKLYAKAQHHPNSVNKRMKSHNFDHLGKFQAYLKKNFAITAEHRDSYDNLPNKAQFDPKWLTK